MDKIKKIIAIGGWVVALLMALYFFISSYLVDNPFPAQPTPTEQVSSK